MKKICFVLLYCLLCVKCYPAAFSSAAYCSNQKGKNTSRLTVADPSEEEYDIHYLKFNLNMNDSFTNVQGDVTTTASVQAATMAVYTFELDTVFTIDSFKLNGTILSIATSGGWLRKATLPAPLSLGAIFTAQVFYHGIPPAGTGFFHGVTHDVSAAGSHMVYTVSDPYVAKDWWPCKQSLQDKIDSVDMWVTVPAGIKVGSNGLLKAVVPVSPSFDQYRWSTHYPIDYYLISLAIAPYTDYKSYVHFTGSPDSMLLQNFFYDVATFVPAYKANFDSLSLMIDYLSGLYGRYPFWKEKYGVCFTKLAGGMEHQTMTTIGSTATPVIAHELGHQWFGDHVTYRTWGHVWLSEGFATYTEQLFINHFWGKVAMDKHRKSQYNNVMSIAGGRVYVDDTTTSAKLFDQRLVYNKGAGVAHMLRFLAPSDSLFFVTLRDYQQAYAFGHATTEDLKSIAATVYTRNLDTFFNQWIYGQGYPVYAMRWNQLAGDVYLNLTQSTSMPSSVPAFSMPVEIRLKSTSGSDTVIKVYNDKASQFYHITWSETVDSVFIDPDNWIIHKTGTVIKDPTLSLYETALGKIVIWPNPSKDYWQVEQLPAGVHLQLININGDIVWKLITGQDSVTIPAQNLPTGNYILKVILNDKEAAAIRLTHG